uniref:Uncharacterized protein n=1 Tax=Noctiluca scintillans TaxID=2966 RepID=A0A7S1AP96_NOCSC|mmetsp:Transcript_54522/g.145504  ORF Transcript_54522/g.145504 Transcript_54522/m.145504 type:complete len:256 (+) Transcript_54522:66-833(+)
MVRCVRCLIERRLADGGSDSSALETVHGETDDAKDVEVDVQLASPQLERCVFCHAADGTQYVPLHFQMGSESASLPYELSLAAHCACGRCWADWERRRYRTKPTVPCPVCQRSVDVGRGYALDGVHCEPCLKELLRRKLPVPPLRKTCRCCGCACVFPLLVLVFVLIASTTFTFALTILMSAVEGELTKNLDAMEPGVLDALLPAAVDEILCPALTLLDVTSGDPLTRMAMSVGSRLCERSGKRKRPRPKPRVAP